MQLKGKRVMIVGRGISGEGAFKALSSRGADCFYYSEEGNLDVDIDLAVVSPGVPLDSNEYQLIKGRNIPIIGELELGFLLCDKPIIAVTGTNGKTTITELIGSILRHDNIKPLVCGNIGVSFSGAVVNEDFDVAVVEVSSFQLETINEFHPRIAIISNITEDHIDRHKTMDGYINAKLNIAKNQTEQDCLIMPQSVQEWLLEAGFLKEIKAKTSVIALCEEGFKAGDGADCVANNEGIFYKKLFVCERSLISLKGEHNLTNALLAISACKQFGVSDEAVSLGLRLFKPHAYRLALTGEHRGKKYFNDSKGTNIDACLAATRAMVGETCLILGGSDKGYEFDGLFKRLPRSIVRIYAVGETAEKIVNSARRCGYDSIDIAYSIKDATISASKLNVKNVLLSPATASFDSYKNYEERGRDFDKIVGEIMQIDSKEWTI